MKLKELEPLLRGPIRLQDETDGTIRSMPATALVRQAYANYTVTALKATPDPIDPDLLITVNSSERICTTCGALIDATDNYCRSCGTNQHMQATCVHQDNAHGHWSSKMVLVRDIMGDCHAGFKCSECGAVLNKTNYCGNCGAKMIEEEGQ